ncbi:hypothetical protein niasHT_017262 [Heterodera trifolii]|uniref:Effector protein n=1 Tax=Heterodera trifolii TaxID=157864 RepID=A0ABD2LGP5_9BILA
MVNSTLLLSIAVLLLLVVFPSAFLQQSLIKCKSAKGSEQGMIEGSEYQCYDDSKCGAIFCSADNGNILGNEWSCYIGYYGEQYYIGLRTVEFDRYRAEHKLRPRANNDQWKCTVHFGAIGVSMSNALFVPPLVKTMKCKKAKQSEEGMLVKDNEEQISSSNICYSYNGKCGAIFCSAENGKYQWNEWACFTASFGDEECYTHRADHVNSQRAIGDLPSPPNAKNVGFWNCSCSFGAVGVNLTNANFVPTPNTTTPTKTMRSTTFMVPTTPEECECAGIRNSVESALMMMIIGLITSIN